MSLEKEFQISDRNAPRVNEKVMAAVARDIKSQADKFKDQPAAVLDLGTGEGYNALLLRDFMQDSQVAYKITCTDIDPSIFKYPTGQEATYLQSDLNQGFRFGSFDFVIATEVMEHLENPYQFMRDCLANLKDDGVLYISTPNTANIFSLIKILLKGIPSFFGYDLPAGHIMPLTPFFIKMILIKLEQESGTKFECLTGYNRNVLLLPIKFGELRPHLTLPGSNRFFGEVGAYRITRKLAK